MEIELDGLRLVMDGKRALVRAILPDGGYMDKIGVEAVLLFGILHALKEQHAQTRKT